MTNETQGYIDRRGDPVFRESCSIGFAASQFLSSQGQDAHVQRKDSPPQRGRDFYTKSKVKIPHTRRKTVEGADGKRTVTVERVMIEARQIPLYITKTKLSLAVDRVTRPANEHPRTKLNYYNDNTGETIDTEDIVFTCNHMISGDWLHTVCDDNIEI